MNQRGFKGLLLVALSVVVMSTGVIGQASAFSGHRDCCKIDPFLTGKVIR